MGKSMFLAAAVCAASVSTGAYAKVILDSSGCPEFEAEFLEKGFLQTFEKNMPLVIGLLQGKEAAEKPFDDIKLVLVNDFAKNDVVANCTAADMSPPPNPARMIGGVVDSTTSPASVTFRTRFLLVPLTVTTCSTRGATISAFAMSSPAFGQ